MGGARGFEPPDPGPDPASASMSYRSGNFVIVAFSGILREVMDELPIVALGAGRAPRLSYRYGYRIGKHVREDTHDHWHGIAHGGVGRYSDIDLIKSHRTGSQSREAHE